jgi:hypothetical protein
MAEVIDPDFDLTTNKVLVSQIPESEITAVVEQLPRIITGEHEFISRLILPVFDNNVLIGYDHAYIAFNKENATEVQLDSKDYFIVDGSCILGILPVEYDRRLF